MPTAPTRPRRMPWYVRLTLLVSGIAAAGTPVYLYLPDPLLTRVLAVFYPPEQYDLGDPDLLATYKLIAAAAVGLVAVIALWVAIASRRRARRHRIEAAVPEPLQAVRQAMAGGDEHAVAVAAKAAAETLGEEAVDDLLRALEAGYSDPTRKQIAAALYQIGRVVTAEVSLHPRT